MKKVLLVVFVLILCGKSFAQTPTATKRGQSVGFSFMLNDFRTANLMKSSSFGGVLNTGQFSELKEMSPGIAFHYSKGIFPNLDFTSSISGSYVRYTRKGAATATSDAFLLEADANARLNLFAHEYAVNPYMVAGVGASLYGVHYGAYIPTGLGVQFRLTDEAQLFTQGQYRFGITDNAANHFNFQLGFAIPVGSKKN